MSKYDPDTILLILLSFLRACAKGGNSKRALNLLQVVKDKGLPIDSYCYTAVMDGMFSTTFDGWFGILDGNLTILNSSRTGRSLCQGRTMEKSAIIARWNAKDRNYSYRGDVQVRWDWGWGNGDDLKIHWLYFGFTSSTFQVLLFQPVAMVVNGKRHWTCYRQWVVSGHSDLCPVSHVFASKLTPSLV